MTHFIPSYASLSLHLVAQIINNDLILRLTLSLTGLGSI
jgi:hypothetical protein